MTKTLQTVVKAVWDLLSGLAANDLLQVIAYLQDKAQDMELAEGCKTWIEGKVWSKGEKEGQEPALAYEAQDLLALVTKGYTITPYSPKPGEVLDLYKAYLNAEEAKAQTEEVVPAEVPSIARDKYLRQVILGMPNLPSSFARSPKGHWYEFSGEALDKVIAAYKQDRSTVNVSVPKVIAGMLAKAELKNEESGLPFNLNNLPLFATRAEYDTWAKAERAKAEKAEQK